MKRIIIAGMMVALCLMTARGDDDWPFGTPKPAAGGASPGGTPDVLPIVRQTKGGRFKEGEIEAAIAAIKAGDYYQKDVPKVSLQDFKVQGPSLVGQVIKLKWSSREADVKESKDGSTMPFVTLREDDYSQHGNSFNFVYQEVKVPPDGMEFVKHLEVSQEIFWGQKPHVNVAYALVLKGARLVFLGHEITEPSAMEDAKFVW